ncbi:hypothetical protein BB360_003126 [Escherichia coli]|nr:hypothetical protein [Escherichia coli]
MPAPVVLILAAGRGERFLASGGNTHKCIGWRQSPEVAPYRWPFEENGRTFDLAIEPQITTNDLRLMLRLALAGGGITIATQETFRPYIESGKLVSLLDDFLPQFPGFYIRSHEAVQHISIRDRLNDFMQQHGTALAAALAPELMGYSELTAIARNCAIQRATDALREALLSWLAKGEKINYSAQDSDILTTIGFRPDAASVDDSREKFTPAQNMIFSRKSAQLASRQSV